MRMNTLNKNSRKVNPGRSMNIYFRHEVYEKLREIVPNREISRLINNLASEYLESNFDERERVKQSLIRTTILRVKSQDIKKMSENISSSSLSDFSLSRKK